MKMRMALATSALVVGIFTLSGCSMPGSAKAAPAPTTPTVAATTTPATTPAATTPSTVSAAADLVGDWQDPKVPWVVHFKNDGTFAEDYQGLTDFRVGKYDVAGTTITLTGDDGASDKGAIQGKSLVFKLGTLTRK